MSAIGPKRTLATALRMSAFGGKAEITSALPRARQHHQHRALYR
jgi:hypothetical protein